MPIDLKTICHDCLVITSCFKKCDPVKEMVQDEIRTIEHQWTESLRMETRNWIVPYMEESNECMVCGSNEAYLVSGKIDFVCAECGSIYWGVAAVMQMGRELLYDAEYLEKVSIKEAIKHLTDLRGIYGFSGF